MDNKLIYNSIIFANIGDIIGFGNGNVEFNYGVSNYFNNSSQAIPYSTMTRLHIYEFIANGGYSNFKIDNYISSDDSILLLATYDALKKKFKSNENKIIDFIKDKLIEYYIDDEKKKRRYYGLQTKKSLNRFIDNKKLKWYNYGYSREAGGCGPAIRCIPIGYFFSEIENRDKLMRLSIQSSRITHNNPMGYLGGFSSSLFISLALNKVEPIKWLDILLSYFSEGKIINFIKEILKEKFDDEIDIHINDINKYFYNLMQYKENKFTKNEYSNSKSNIQLDYRNYLFYKKYTIDDKLYNPGGSGLDCILIAYDSLLESKGNFEKLIYYSMLHAGDSDSTGCLAGALFGCYYNIEIPDNFKNIELIDKINELYNS